MTLSGRSPPRSDQARVSMRWIDVGIEAATAQTAFFGPCLARSRLNCALQVLSVLRLAAQAHCTRVVWNQGAPWRRREVRRLASFSEEDCFLQKHQS